MSFCNTDIHNSMLIRCIITIFSLSILYLYNNIIHKYIFLILPILLTILDSIDSLTLKKYKCVKTFYYQSLDKIIDSISYLLIFLFFKLDNIFLFFIFYRIIGVILFYITKKSKWLILFFDFTKELLLYIFIFGNNYIYLPIFIICKIIFEYSFHNIINKPDYSKTIKY